MIDRAQILRDTFKEPLREDRSSGDFLARFAHGPIQAYLVDEYHQGRPGHSLTDFWAALVPRVVWGEKPVITRFGPELHGLYWSQSNPHSAFAPTYTAPVGSIRWTARSRSSRGMCG